MSNITLVDTKSAFNFVCNVASGSRPFIRLLNSACGWAEAVAGKAEFIFFNCKLDVSILGKSFLKPLDNSIYVIKGVSGWCNFHEKTWTPIYQSWTGKIVEEIRDSKGKLFKIKETTLTTEQRVFKAFAGTQHGFKTISDSAAGLRFLAFAGLVVLTPYIRTFTLVKSGFAVSAGMLKITCCVHRLWGIVNVPVKNEEDFRRQQLKWASEMLMIIIQIFSIQLNFFGGCKTLLDSVVESEKHMPEILFNFWGTGASLATFGHIAVEYIQGPPAK